MRRGFAEHPWKEVSPGSSGLFDILKFFADIDECSQGPSPCGPNSVCTNALGSYSCSCIGGFQPNPEGSLNFSCKSNHLFVSLGNGICLGLAVKSLTYSNSGSFSYFYLIYNSLFSKVFIRSLINLLIQ